MQNKELCLSVGAIANEKQISQDEVFLALEEALALACEKRTGFSIRVSINRDTGEFETFRRWLVVADGLTYIDENDEVAFNEVHHTYQKDANGVELEDFIEERIADIELSRVTAQIVKQVIIQKVRESERARIASEYEERIGETISATVKRVDHGTVFVELGGLDGIIPRSETIQNELVRKGDRIKAYLKEVKNTSRGVQIILSRCANELLVNLLAMEVPEISEGVIEVMGVARDPGLRAKVALRSRDKRIDPIGSAIGMRGSRIQAVSDGINGERIDVILWDEDIAKFVVNAMAPATVLSIIVDEDKQMMEVAVEDEQLAQAIGKGGQNIILASGVTGWRINVMSQEELIEKQQNETQVLEQVLADKLDVDASIAIALIKNGIDSLEAITNTDHARISSINGFDDEIAEALKDRASDELLAQALDSDGHIETLLTIEGVDDELANALLNGGIQTQDNLADLSIDELLDIYDMPREQASKIILTARAPWFE